VGRGMPNCLISDQIAAVAMYKMHVAVQCGNGRAAGCRLQAAGSGVDRKSGGFAVVSGLAGV
jgi:hypothetical protein